ncbi:MAG TPA: prepilin peptidase [Bacilli bacterium]|nr:prepilin peptidase [Bacilli bacterium]
MDAVYIIIFFVFGLFFGSFYNVVGDRLPNNLSIVKPRSMCPNCGKTLKWYELIPVFSFIFLGGKCKSCKARISLFYPITEIGCGFLFALSYYVFGFSYDLAIALTLSSLFIIILVSDLNYLIIPDEVIIFFSIFLIVLNFVCLGYMDGLVSFINGAVLFIIMFLLLKLGNYIFKKESLGGGDVKLMFVLGMTMPLINSFMALFVGAVLALVASLIVIFKTRDNVVPFGPFLVAGSIIVLFLGEYFTKIIS